MNRDADPSQPQPLVHLNLTINTLHEDTVVPFLDRYAEDVLLRLQQASASLGQGDESQ